VDSRGVEAYLPRLPPSQGAERSTLLFPGYLFAWVTQFSDDVLRIRSAPGVAYPLPHGGPPTFLAHGVVDLIRKRLGGVTSALRPGDRVTLINGPFCWMDAVFDRRMNAAGRVRILLEMAHRTVSLNVEEASLRRA
jgi:transcription antitermination factor NusG